MAFKKPSLSPNEHAVEIDRDPLDRPPARSHYACRDARCAVYYGNSVFVVIHMSASRFSTSDLSRKSGDLIAEALRHPVTITQRNKPRLVLMNVEDYERLMVQADPRKTVLTKDMPEDLLDQVEGAIDAYAESGPD